MRIYTLTLTLDRLVQNFIHFGVPIVGKDCMEEVNVSLK